MAKPFRGAGNGLRPGHPFPLNPQLGTRSHPFRTCSRNRLGSTRSGRCPCLWQGTGTGTGGGDAVRTPNCRFMATKADGASALHPGWLPTLRPSGARQKAAHP